MASNTLDVNFLFFEQLNWYYQNNKGKRKKCYKDLTRKFLSYNDVNENKDAFLRKPQFEALEMYVFLKEFAENPQVSDLFDKWHTREGKFSDASYYSVNRKGTLDLFADLNAKQTDSVFKQMKKYQENYPNYIYALTMGLGKTILMATCIFYEFLLAKQYPKSPLYCHNALVFAPDKTVLESLREIQSFDKSKVVPLEYVPVLDSNIKFHFLEQDESSSKNKIVPTLQTIDGSDFNIVISNTQKIIVKKKHKQDSYANILFGDNSLLSALYGKEDVDSEDTIDASLLVENQRYKKICRLPQLGVYVDEAHHLFGADLEKALRSGASKTSLRNTINLISEKTKIVACYNYTGTPYVKKQVLPEVVYSYGLKNSISNGYLKEAVPKGIENVKSKEFLRYAVSSFWKKNCGIKYEELNPKLAIFAATVEEAVNEVRPMVEEILSELGIPSDKVLVNVGDSKFTKDEDLKNFKNLDVPGSKGNDKQFIILVGKGREGWNCRSLLGVAMFREPDSTITVLQSTMRCLRQLSDKQLSAQIFLSKSNFNILENELNENFNIDIKDLSGKKDTNKQNYHVRLVPPPVEVILPKLTHIYSIESHEYKFPIDFDLDKLDLDSYHRTIYVKDGISSDFSIKKVDFDEALLDSIKYTSYTLAYEISRYLNISPILAHRIITESKDGIDKILGLVNQFNDIIQDIIIPKVFNSLFTIKTEVKETEEKIQLLKSPSKGDYYEFEASPELVISKDYVGFKDFEKSKTFHADTYCFDSKPEKELFLQYVKNNKIKRVYFTGMFTSEQCGLRIQYFDPESKRLRYYYPDFFAELEDGSYQIIEVKGDNMLDDPCVQAKKAAAEEITSSARNTVNMNYVMYAGSQIMNTNVLDDK